MKSREYIYYKVDKMKFCIYRSSINDYHGGIRVERFVNNEWLYYGFSEPCNSHIISYEEAFLEIL